MCQNDARTLGFIWWGGWRGSEKGMRLSQGTHDWASQGHDALSVHSELLELKEWRTVLAGYTFVIFVTQEGSCGNSRPAVDYGELLDSFSQPHKQTSGMRQEDPCDGGICRDYWVHSPRMPLVGWITGEKTPRVKASLNTHSVLP